MKYIWQMKNWTQFTWNTESILADLAFARKKQGLILGKGDFFQLKELGEFITEEALSTSEIEGEKLDKTSIRSSVARRLGLPEAGLPEPKKSTDGLVELLIDATSKYSNPLTEERICGWQASLFPTGYSGVNKIQVGDWRNDKFPMRVISGSMGKEKVHYEAPPSGNIAKEMDLFFDWWIDSDKNFDGIIRAAIAHFYFITIHPFDDGNGRIARALTDMALAQDEKTGKRLYSLSSQINEEKSAYYNILEQTQKGESDLTGWLNWFLQMFSRSIDNSLTIIEKSVFINTFYRKLSELSLNKRQIKAIGKLLEQYPEGFSGGLTNKKYVSMTKISPETAKRDIKDLVRKKILVQNEGRGRSTSYKLNEFI